MYINIDKIFEILFVLYYIFHNLLFLMMGICPGGYLSGGIFHGYIIGYHQVTSLPSSVGESERSPSGGRHWGVYVLEPFIIYCCP